MTKTALTVSASFQKIIQSFMEDLFSLWIAEGLDERMQRNMAQTSEGIEGYNYCRVHDLMHEIILSRADDFRFFQIPE